jgi:hypothetical protein
MADAVPMGYWTYFSGEAKRGQSPLYERLALAIGGDEKLRAMAAHAKPGQPQANLIFGAAHYLLLRGETHPLADYYPSVRPNARPTGDPSPLFTDFCRKHEAEIVRLIERRVTNTNEVARSTQLYPAFDHIAHETNAELHLVEIGPSAGFNLNWDRYHYAYRRNGHALTRGASDARLKLEVPLRGDHVPPLLPAFPKVASRVGLELNPVDLQSAEDRLWLKALIWPELGPRFARLDAAIATTREFPHRIVHGNALELPEGAVTDLPSSGLAVVYHSYVTYQFSEAMRLRLNEIIEALSHKRTIYRVSIEWEGGGNCPIIVGRCEKGSVTKRTIALCDGHAAWLEWCAP